MAAPRLVREEASHIAMLRLIHTADVHLGARHDDLGEQAAAQRERQFAAFAAAVDLALAEQVDLFLIAGDLFDSNVQPRRSVERVGAQLKRLAEARIRTVVIPGTHDCYDRASIYRAYDLPALAGTGPDDGMVTILEPDRPSVHLATLDAVIHGPVFATKRAPHSPLQGFAAALPADATAATWQIGMVHGSIAIPGKTDRDEVVITTEEIAASGLDYLALGHWHSAQQGRAGTVTYAYPGAPEAVALDQDRAGKVLLVQLEERGGQHHVTVEERPVGRTRFAKTELDAATVESQPAVIALLAAQADPDLVLDARLVGVRRDDLDLDVDEIEVALAPSFLKVRVRDGSMPALTEGPLPSEDTIAGAFIRDLEGRIAQLEAAGSTAEAAEHRDALRLGRLLLAGHEVSL
jgi:exonuclease SbcD